MTCLSNSKMNGWRCEMHPEFEFLHVVGAEYDDNIFCDAPGTRCLCEVCDLDTQGKYSESQYYYRIYNGSPS